METRRLFKLLLFIAVLTLCGILYALLYRALGFGIPCTFHKITGLQCPGCGITRMFVCLFSGDLYGAWTNNAAVLCLLIPGLAVGVDIGVRYIKYGSRKPNRWASVLLIVILVVLVLFGILRNFN